MSALYSALVSQFLAIPETEVLSRLSLAYAKSGFVRQFTEQTLTWEHDLQRLRLCLEDVVNIRPEIAHWTVALEYEIPRKSKRIDVVLLTRTKVIAIECKRSEIKSGACEQIEEYAMLLHYFHKETARRFIEPIAIANAAKPPLSERSALRTAKSQLPFDTLASYWIKPTRLLTWADFPAMLNSVSEQYSTPKIDPAAWLSSAYHPVPTIIEAARDLRDGLKIRDIARCEASEHDIEEVSRYIYSIAEKSREREQHAICFVTGVPGSGKTLVGLSLAHLGERREDAIHFMSGNGPLVQVLQENFRRKAMSQGVPAPQAKIQSKTLIENVHVFAKAYTEDNEERAPSNHVVIFDEAQRAWNREQNKSKFKRDYSEPEMLLRIMERHKDWAMIVALVGGGQEINNGEAGLEEWGRALTSASKHWRIYASPEVMKGGSSTAGRRLLTDSTIAIAETNDLLHLRTSNRSLRADNLAVWVNAVLDGDAVKARSVQITSKYPIFLTRSLNSTRNILRTEALAGARFGLVGSSKAARLRAEGLEPDSAFHAEYKWFHWYLSDETDVRSSYRCEVFATEFEIQGLELDWVGLCWGGDFIRSGERWVTRDLRMQAPSRWTVSKNSEREMYRRNAYRVLLTRARQGMVIFVPQGDDLDATRNPDELNGVAEFLESCGVHHLA